MNFKNLMNSSTSHLMSILCKSTANKYMIMVRNVIDDIMKNMIKLIFLKRSLGTKIIFYLKYYHAQYVGLQLVDIKLLLYQ